MSILHLKNISLHYGTKYIFDQISLQIEHKQRIAIIGRNGTGKSTLLKVIQREVSPDSGTIEEQPHTIASLPQEIPRDSRGTVYDNILESYTTHHDNLDNIYQVDRVISQLQLNPDALVQSLSGGGIRRCLLAQALVNEPDILLLDEPTNHLDIESIQWLEQLLIKLPITCIIITHDRSFLQKVANRIVELDRGHLTCWDGNYHGFLRHKEQELHAEAQANALFDKRLAQEEVWIRQGIKARRTRNEGRVRDLKKMRQERSNRRELTGTVQLKQQSSSPSGKIVCHAENISVSFNDNVIIDDFSCIIQRQDKIGLIGPNGCGKTTLIECLLKHLTPTQGKVTLGTQLSIAYFDQHRMQLDPEDTVMDAVSEGRSHITINDTSKHIIGYLQDFLFPPETSRSKISTLSGGECNRVMLAKLFATPANLLILDEPTNDLDIETLELLEDYIVSFKGTVLIVSHDRTFLNNVITSSFVFGSNGKITEYAGGFDDIALQQTTTSSNNKSQEGSKQNQISYKERKELNKIPSKIENLEKTIQSLQDTINQDGFYSQQATITDPIIQSLHDKEQQLNELYQRWEALAEKDQ